MKVEQILYEYPYIVERINDIRIEIKQLQYQIDVSYVNMACPIGNMDGMPVSNRKSDPTAQAVIMIHGRLSDRINRLTCEKHYLAGKIKEIDRKMEALTEMEREIIYLKYHQRRSWRDISNMMEKSRQACEKYRRRAIDKMT